MIDLHTHTLLSDGELLPSELVRRAWAKGYKAIALTDHVDSSNIDFVLPRIVKVCKVLNKHWKEILSIPGVEITHAPLEEIKPLVKSACPKRFSSTSIRWQPKSNMGPPPERCFLRNQYLRSEGSGL